MKNSKNNRPLLNALITIFTGLLFLGIQHTAFASPQIAVTVKNPNPYTGNQSWFVYERKPGETIDDVVSVKNYGDQTANVKIYAVDATSDNSGSFILKFNNEQQKSIGIWTEIKQAEYQIGPDERIDIPFKIKIPKEASPSQYLGGIIAETGGANSENTTGTNGSIKTENGCPQNGLCSPSISVKTRIGARIYLTIPGEIKEHIDLIDFQNIERISGKTYFKFKIKNDGNVAYEPKAEIEIRDLSGNLYDKFEKSLGNSLPDTTIEPTISWDKKPPLFGRFTAKATVSFPQRFKPADLKSAELTTSKSVTFTFIPWEIVSLFIFLLLIAAATIYRRKAKFKMLLADATKYQVKEDEHIGDLAEINKVDWQDLVILNKLKPPYVVKKGDIILIPKTKK